MTDLKTPENMQPDEVVGEEELVAADDSIIGKAFLWSLLVFAVIGVGVLSMVLLMGRTELPLAHADPVFLPPKPVESEHVAPATQFSDITSGAAIDFVHVNGARGEKLLPETMGGGCAFLDYDNDGDADILLINSMNWPESNDSEVAARTGHALYRNDGKGQFTDVTHAAGLDFSSYGMGVAVGDYDNDGFVDVFISSLGRNELFRNRGDGTFANVTDHAQVAGAVDDWSTSCGFVDYNNDGLLDLFVCNYVKWSRQIDFAVNYTLVGIGRAYGPPNNFAGTHSYLYQNNGDGTFTDVSEAAGLHINGVLGSPMGKALAVTFVDIERDGWIDILVANDTVQNFLFHNQGDGTFVERGGEFGIAFDRNGAATGAMGIDAAWHRGDQTLGIAIGNFANEMSSLYVAHDDPHQFSDESISEGIGSPTRASLTFGVLFLDADLDGRPDLLHANGHIEDQINIVQPSQRYAQPGQFFWNAGSDTRACFVESGPQMVGDVATPIVGRGAAYADIDEDGDLDLLLTQINGRPLLLRNDQTLDHNWLRLKLVGNGRTVNRDAIGARVELISGGMTQTQQVMPTRSYLSQVELPVTFGLGKRTEVELVRIHWPDRTITQIQLPALNQTLVIPQQ